MGDSVGAVPGKQSGVAAGDFVGSSRASPELVPGKRNLVQSTSLGNAYGDHGAKCDGKGQQTPGCFMTDDARKRYFDLFGFLVGGARENFKNACTGLQVKEFLKKEEELDWFTSLVLDFASTFLIGAAAKGLKYLKNAGANALLEQGVEIDRKSVV